jgi:hypothetical protein
VKYGTKGVIILSDHQREPVSFLCLFWVGLGRAYQIEADAWREGALAPSAYQILYAPELRVHSDHSDWNAGGVIWRVAAAHGSI